MPKALKQLVPAGTAAKTGRRLSPAGKDQLFRKDLFLPVFGRKPQPEAAHFPPQSRNFGSGQRLDPKPFQFHPKDVHDRGGLKAHREELSVFLFGKRKPHLSENLFDPFDWKTPQRRKDKLRVRAVVMLNGRAPVGDVAASVSGRQELLSDPRAPLDQKDPASGDLFCGSDRGDHAGRSAACDRNHI